MKIEELMFAEPNNPRLPVLVYRQAVELPKMEPHG